MKLILLFTAVFILILCGSCAENKAESAPYGVFDEKALLKLRDENAEWFGKSADSPVHEFSNRHKYSLQYYPPDSKYMVYASAVRNRRQDTVIMPTRKTNDFRKFLDWGRLKFRLEGKSYKLRAYSYLDPALKGKLFIPFADKTNGSETYEAGRYMEADIRKYKKVMLDFNYAYNPYCHYNHNYSCPLVPDENYLDTEIKAGEKIVKFEE